MSSPSWRRLELALLEVMKCNGFEVSYERGDSFIEVAGVNICIGDLAKELAKELES